MENKDSGAIKYFVSYQVLSKIAVIAYHNLKHSFLITQEVPQKCICYYKTI